MMLLKDSLLKNKRLFFSVYGIVFILIIVDQLTKYWARIALTNRSLDFGLLRFDLVFNTGTAYGLFSEYTTILTYLGIAVIIYLVIFLASLVHNRFDEFAYACLISGAIGNTIDRLLFSKVTDFINIQIIPVFNVADILLNIGIYGIILKVIFSAKKK